MAFIRNTLFTSALALMFCSSADAHVSMNPKFAEPGQNLTTAFHVPHGCNGSSTVSVSVTIPKNITVITGQQVANWTVATEYTDSTNTTVNTISWSGGPLKATDAACFPITLSVPKVDLSAQPNVTLYFPVVQTCEVGANHWTTIPAAGADANAAGEPAPVLVIVKNATQAAADALAIKNANNSTATATPSASGNAATKTNAANGLYAGLLPVAAALGALAISL